MPFPVKVDGYKFDIAVNSQTLVNVSKADRLTIQPGEIRELNCDTDLADNQANIVRKVPGDCTILHLQGDLQILSTVNEFKKYISLNTRGFIHR